MLFTVAVLGVWAFLFPAAHPMDLLYNHVVRPLFGAARLPPNPHAATSGMLVGRDHEYAGRHAVPRGPADGGLVVGGLLLVLQAIVIATHFCALSWIYEGVARMVGSWNLPVEPEVAQRLLREGAQVIDVRTPQEYAENTWHARRIIRWRAWRTVSASCLPACCCCTARAGCAATWPRSC